MSLARFLLLFLLALAPLGYASWRALSFLAGEGDPLDRKLASQPEELRSLSRVMAEIVKVQDENRISAPPSRPKTLVNDRISEVERVLAEISKYSPLEGQSHILRRLKDLEEEDFEINLLLLSYLRDYGVPSTEIADDLLAEFHWARLDRIPPDIATRVTYANLLAEAYRRTSPDSEAADQRWLEAVRTVSDLEWRKALELVTIRKHEDPKAQR